MPSVSPPRLVRFNGEYYYVDKTPHVQRATNTGKVDMAVSFAGQHYLFEFKVVEQAPEEKTLQQLKDKGYAEKYRGRGEPIHLVGVEFSRERRAVAAFEWGTV